MDTTSGGINPLEEFPEQLEESKLNVPAPKYAYLSKAKPYMHENIRVPPKPVVLLHGEPSITRKSSEIKRLIMQKNLQLVIIGKFSYDKPNVTELTKDYVQLLSTNAYYIKAKDMFEPNVETTVAVA
ncbi:hypothetical protein FXO38_14698 [Capsicum annuum]|nr:hypothetical protein FXO38_14698 [Capsicum annuum]KAF3670450.1 hypothetical protein FXO37_08530 [Capsicum annuum]